jgi:hypothetical protein
MNPVFLVGAERSGTTLLRLMLNGHSTISWLNEFEYSVDRVIEPDCWPDMENYIEYLSTHRIFQATEFVIDETLDYLELIKSFLLQKQLRDSKPIIGATCHRHYDRLLRMFPKARFIYLLRDPRDVAHSNIGMGWAGNVWTGVDRWVESVNLWENVKQSLEKSSYIEVSSETLITSPRETLTSICEFLHVPYEDDMMKYPEYTTYSKPDPSLTEQWKRKLSPDEISFVEAKTHELMKHRGYQPLFDLPPKISFLMKVILLVQDKYSRVCFKVKHYGFWLITADFLARKLRIKFLERELKFHFHKKTKKFLK